MSIVGSNALAGASGQAGAGADGFTIQRSLRFNRADSSYLERTPSSETNRRTWTWSAWLKRSDLASNLQGLFGAGVDDYDYTGLYFQDDELKIEDYPGGGIVRTQPVVLRDVSAWYHIVLAVDTTQSTAADRVKFYLNGVQLTTSGTWAQNTQTRFNKTQVHRLGKFYPSGGSNDHFTGYFADVNFIDGQQMAASDFAEADSNGVWQAKDTSGLTFGTNGFRLQFANNVSDADLGTDTSSNNNTWTVNNLIALGEAVSTSAITNVGSTTGTVYYSDNNNNAYDPNNLTVFSSGQHSTTASNMRHVKIADLGTGSIALTHVSGNNFYITGSNTTTNTNSSPLVHGTTGAFTINSSFGYAYARIYAGGGGQITYNATVTGPSIPVLTTTNNNNYSSLAVGKSNSAGVSITAINSSTPSITVDGGSWSVGDVFTTVINDNGDNLLDTPTNYDDGTNIGGNYATLNALAGNNTLSNGNLDITGSTSGWLSRPGTIGMSSGKWYFELTNTGDNDIMIGIGTADAALNNFAGNDAYGYSYYASNGNKYNSGAGTSYGATWTAGDTVAAAFDADNGTLVFYKNGASQGTAYTGLTSGPYFPIISNATTDSSGSVNFGARPFAYTPPSNHLALVTSNLSAPTIADPSTAFDTKLFTGNGTSQTISGYNFSPDFAWFKSRNGNDWHALVDAVRGKTKVLFSNSNNAEETRTEGVSSFNSDGFSLGDYAPMNKNNDSIVAWAWDVGANSSKTYTVTVVSDSGNKYRFDGHGTSAVTLDLEEGSTYVFDQSDSSNSGHPLRFSTTSDGTHGGGSEYTTGVTATGTPGSAGAKTTIVVASGAPTLYYYCSSHSGMGGQVNTNSTAGATVLSGSLNSSVYNTSRVWSDGIANPGSDFDQGAPNAFNGNRSNSLRTGGNSVLVTLNFSPALTVNSTIEILGEDWPTADFRYTVTVDGTTTTKDVNQGQPAIFNVSGSLTQITVDNNSGGGRTYLTYIVVDGKELVNSNITPPNVPSISSIVRANPTAGISVVGFTGNGSAQSVAHSLSAAPEFIILKNRETTQYWHTYHKTLGANKYMYLNGSNAAQSDPGMWNNVEPTSSVFTVGSYALSNNYVAICFTSVSEFSSFGEYTGNGSATDGTFVYTGFKIAFLLIKESSGSDAWIIWDNARQNYNAQGPYLQPQSYTSEGDADYVDFLSNGFKWRTTNGAMNASGSTYVYAAFAEHPLSLNGGIAR